MLHRLLAYVRGLAIRRRVETEVDDELAFHLEQETRANVARGMEPDEARRVALGALGGLTQTAEAVRDTRTTWLDTCWRDIRHAVRGLRRNPAYAAVTLLTLAFGIGANTAIFSIADGVLLKPLTYGNADRLVAVREWNPQQGLIPVNAMHFREWRTRSESFEALALVGANEGILTGAGEPERLQAARVSPALFAMLGAEPQLGRFFLDEEDVAGEDQVVILTDGLWRRRFGADPGIVGRAITLNDTPREVVGVLTADFDFPRLAHLYAMPIAGERPDYWIPLAPVQAEMRPDGAFNFICLGLLAPGRTADQAEMELNGMERGITAAEPSSPPALRTSVVPLRTQIVDRVSSGLMLMLGAVGLVLVIAAVNVANLSLARLSARRHELAIKAALGAGRWTLTREILTEGLVVAFLGGTLGLLVGAAGLRAMLSLAPPDVPRLMEVHLDSRVLAFTLGITTLTGLLVGTLGSWRFGLTDAREVAASGTRATASGSSLRLRSTLVAAEVAPARCA